MSSMAIESLLDQQARSEGKDPREAGHNNDLFARNDDNVYVWQWTSTGLRVPKRSTPNYDPDTPDHTDGQGRKYWVKELLAGDKVIGEVLVPEGNGRVIVEWDPVTGLPLVTSNNEADMKYENHDSHWWYFNSNPDIDSNTGKQDVAVRRGSTIWRPYVHDGCLGVDAEIKRFGPGLGGSFRPVQGSLSVSAEKFTPEQASQILLLREYERGRKEAINDVALDLSVLSISELLEKYRP
jgi:hypothetical protein